MFYQAHKECPYCKEEIKAVANKCIHCHSLLDDHDLINKSDPELAEKPVMVKGVKGTGRKISFMWVPVSIIIILIILMASGTLLNGGSEEAAGIEAGEEDENNQAATPGPDSGPDAEGVTVEDIVNKYEPKFQALEDQVAAELTALFNAASKEYEQGSGNPLFQLQLINKYTREIQRVEDRADAAFYSLLDQMKDELVSHGLPTDVIAEIEEDYKKEKQAMKRELTRFLTDRGNW